MSHSPVTMALEAWRAAVRRLERVVRLRDEQAKRPRNVSRDATLERLERQARAAEQTAHERYREADEASRPPTDVR